MKKVLTSVWTWHNQVAGQQIIGKILMKKMGQDLMREEVRDALRNEIAN